MPAKYEYASEAHLCAAFIEWVKAVSGKVDHGHRTPVWTPYAETAGWDILLVADDGAQIGIEAKLNFNMKVLAQAMPENYEAWRETGPDFRAILVPNGDDSHRRICAALGLLIFTPRRGYGNQQVFEPALLPDSPVSGYGYGWHDWNPTTRCKLPEYLPDVRAGCPAPLRLTEWKVQALRILATADARGYVTKADFKRLRIDPRAWVGTAGWLMPGAQPGQYVRGAADFDKQHPTVYAQVLAEVSAEVAKELPAPPPPQTALFAQAATA